MGLCDKIISQDFGVDCDNLPVQGINQTGVIINWDDIDWTATKAKKVGTNVYSGIVLNTGKKGYKIKQIGRKPFNNTNSAAEVGDSITRFGKNVSFIMMENSATISTQVDALSNGMFVIILENLYRGADESAAFEIYGIEASMRMSEGSKESYNEDSNGAWVITMQEQKAALASVFLFDTDYTTSKAAFDAITATPA